MQNVLTWMMISAYEKVELKMLWLLEGRRAFSEDVGSPSDTKTGLSGPNKVLQASNLV